MDFAFSDEQEMLRNSARELMGDRYPRQRIAAIADGRGFDRAEWKWIIEVGWAGISVPEDEGGSGLSFFEELLLTEELGRACYPGPFFSTVVLAVSILSLARAGPPVGPRGSRGGVATPCL